MKSSDCLEKLTKERKQKKEKKVGNRERQGESWERKKEKDRDRF